MDIRLIYSIFCIIVLNFNAAMDITETTESKKALTMFLKNREISKKDNDSICGPLRYEDETIPNYTNADKICYLAYKHPYITEKHKFRKLANYKKEPCESRSVLNNTDMKKFHESMLPPNLHDFVTTKLKIFKVDTGLCHCTDHDFFYVAGTSKKDYYAILMFAPNVLYRNYDEPKQVVAILKLECNANDFSEMQIYFKETAIKVKKNEENKISGEKSENVETSAGKKIKRNPKKRF